VIVDIGRIIGHHYLHCRYW